MFPLNPHSEERMKIFAFWEKNNQAAAAWFRPFIPALKNAGHTVVTPDIFQDGPVVEIERHVPNADVTVLIGPTNGGFYAMTENTAQQCRKPMITLGQEIDGDITVEEILRRLENACPVA